MGITVVGEFLNNCKFADDIVFIADSFDQAQTLLEGLFTTSKGVGLRINFPITKFLTNLVCAKNNSDAP